MTSGRLPVSAHEGQGLVMWRQASQGRRVSPAHGGACPGWGPSTPSGDISVRSGAFDVVGDRDPAPGRAGCPLRMVSPNTIIRPCPQARRLSPSAAACTRPREMSPDVQDRWGQVVCAPLMVSLSFSVGVCPFKTMRGRRLRWPWMSWTWGSVMAVKLVPLGRCSRIRRSVCSAGSSDGGTTQGGLFTGLADADICAGHSTFDRCRE